MTTLPLLTRRYGATQMGALLLEIVDAFSRSLRNATAEGIAAEKKQQKLREMEVKKNTSAVKQPVPCKKNKYQKHKRVRRKH